MPASAAPALFVLFRVGRERYALPARDIVEILPLIHLKQLPGAPTTIAGIFTYRGVATPVIDLTQCLIGSPAAACISTRIIITNYISETGKPHTLGLMAEHANETLSRSFSDFQDDGVEHKGTSYLGPVTQDEQGLIQMVHAQRLLPPEVQAILFREPSATEFK